MNKIKEIRGMQILDSRGNPTVLASVTVDGGGRAEAAVPSGASTGAHEAHELRDGDPERYRGKGVLQALAHINGEIAAALRGHDVRESADIDQLLCELDGTPNKSRLGANAILAVSMACARAAAQTAGLPLYRWLAAEAGAGGAAAGGAMRMPVPQINILNGGAHADNAVDLQEFMVVPVGLPSFSEALRCGAEIFHALKDVLRERGLATGVGDEGGFAPDLACNADAAALVLEAVERAGYSHGGPGAQVMLALDVASTELYRQGRYRLASEQRELDADSMVALLGEWCDSWPLISIEDGMAEDDWEGWAALSAALGGRVQLTGDDLFVTNSAILQRGIDAGIANAILIKLNQIGTLRQTLDAVALAQSADYAVTISHRSGETADTFIADLAVATGAGQIKTGSLCRSERVAKYNRLLQIEAELGEDAIYPGMEAFTKA